MKATLLTTEIQTEPDVVAARQRARFLAELLGFDLHGQTRIATAVSELARNAFQYAGRGRVQFGIESSPKAVFSIRISDRGPGIANIAEIFHGHYQSKTGMGVGLLGAKKLMDGFRIETAPGEGTTIDLSKNLPPRAPPLTLERLAWIGEELAKRSSEAPLDEVRQKNQELLLALEALEERQDELTRLNRELAETNAGVVALYSELDEKAEALRRSTDAKARFFSEMNHEVRTPINSILGLSEILINGSLVKPLPAQEKPLGFIRKGAEQLSVLVNDLLDLAKVESGKMIVRPERFTVAELFSALRGVFRPLHTNDAVDLVFEDVTALAPLETDEGKVSQVLRNFVSNALKFTERGEVRVSAYAEGDWVRFCVTDTGMGISSEDQRHLFQEFSQIENPKQKTARGTGLGLAVSRSLATILGGTVSATSTQGQGSTFTLTIPPSCIASPASETPPSSFRPQAGSALPPKKARILIIDDDPIARFVLTTFLGGLPLETFEAGSGTHGVRLAQEQQPDAIFLDLSMPDLTGYEVIGLLKADPRTRDIPVIVNTSKRLSLAERERLSASTVAILSKGEASHTATREAALNALEEVGLLETAGAV